MHFFWTIRTPDRRIETQAREGIYREALTKNAGYFFTKETSRVVAIQIILFQFMDIILFGLFLFARKSKIVPVL